MKPNKWYRLVLGSALILLLGGCASWSKPLDRSAAASGQDAYFYGSFQIESANLFLSMDGYATMGLEFLCKDKARYTFRFNNKSDQAFQVIKVKPGNCSLRWIIFTNGDGEISATRDAPANMAQSFDVKPGAAYYIGNFEGAMSYSGWEMRRISDDYASDTELLKLLYPGLADVTTIDQMAMGKPDSEQPSTGQN